MTTEYVTPLVERFATKEMAEVWSPQKKFLDLAPVLARLGRGGTGTGAAHHG